LNTSALFFCLAGNFSLIPSAVQRMFGPKQGPTIFGAMFSAFALASIVGGMLTKGLVKSLGYKTVFYVMAGMSILATLMVSLLKPTQSYPESSV
jgi:predicted MFS family arabinose efflux permease